eukprot:snap_masked-scaffold_7-processed-gene-8.45-mRNA-1 protein AED:1.00 eAED:1.00 QI:0/0/0/0/1/1/2/0/107
MLWLPRMKCFTRKPHDHGLFLRTWAWNLVFGYLTSRIGFLTRKIDESWIIDSYFNLDISLLMTRLNQYAKWYIEERRAVGLNSMEHNVIMLLSKNKIGLKKIEGKAI